jgi:hypothetical protein
MRNHIKEILFALTDGGVEYVIGGGVAAVLHGVERVTLDIDIAADLEPENLCRLTAVTTELGLQPRVPIPLEALADPEAVRMMVEEKHALVFSLIDPGDPLRYLDLFLKPDLSYRALITDAVKVMVEGRSLRVVSAGRLLSIKRAIQPPREKDCLDIVALERIVNAEHPNNNG